MKIETYAIDNDDVLYPVGQRYCCDFYNHLYGTKFKLEDLTNFNLSERWNVPLVEIWRIEREFYTSIFYNEMKPIPGATELVEYLSQRKPLHLVTSRGSDVTSHTLYKLSQDFGHTHFTGVHHVGPHAFGFPFIPKWKKCVELNATTLLEDYHNTVIQAAIRGINGVLFTKPWNKNISDFPKNVYRVRHPLEAIEVIEKYNL